jgi:DNA mismatch repair protein MutS
MPVPALKHLASAPENSKTQHHHFSRSQERGGRISFHSILFDESEIGIDVDGRDVPEIFTDLNLDQVVASLTAGRDEYNLKPFFYVPLRHVGTINYRYDALRDLENEALFGHIQAFADEMRQMRGHLAQADKLYYSRQRQSWFLDAVEIYCAAVKCLTRDLMLIGLRSRGFLAFREYLASYTSSDDFQSLTAETEKLKTDLRRIRYSLYIHAKRITVMPYDAAPDYSADVLHTFEKFRQGVPKEYQFGSQSSPDMNQVEVAILDLVAQLYPEVFSTLDNYCRRYSGYLNSKVVRFDREVQFYIACLEHMQRFKRAGLPFCYPAVLSPSKEVLGRDVFDLALADKLIRENSTVVTNDFYMRDPERIFVVSGPNQGGKTTFARTFGQLHYLASLGCPVPGSEAKLFLCDKLFTHFEKEEDIRNLSGKLEDELLRIHRILEGATSNSILIMNESFLSTTLHDALFLSKHVMQRIITLDMLCVSVTFLDELASLGETTVSMVSTVNPQDPALRTFKLIRKPADGLAYAAAIAKKYGLTHDAVKARIAERVKEGVTP